MMELNRIRPAVTDPARVKRSDPGTPELCNLYSLHKHFSSSDTVDDVATKCRTAGWGCIDCKRVLADNIAETFSPLRERARRFTEDPDRVDAVLAEGADKARHVARETMRGVRDAMGLLPGAVSEARTV